MEGGLEHGADLFERRHIGPSPEEIQEMLKFLGYDSLDAFTNAVIPKSIRQERAFILSPFPAAMTEQGALARLKSHAAKNKIRRSYIGTGYYDCHVPGVIQRNILENPGWYTQYTPYQPEISQGRLEALLNFQTMVSDLTGLPIANASLLDEGTAAAEAMTLSHAVCSRTQDGSSRTKFFVSQSCHPQTQALVRTRAEALGWEIVCGDPLSTTFTSQYFGALLQYPDTFGKIEALPAVVEGIKSAGALVTVATDLLALTLLAPPGEWGADIAVGSAQRFGVPLGFGGPHAAFFATRDEHKRLLPGRLIGVSVDGRGRPALRLSLQTREQHIRREKATSNICTAQVLLAIMASMYAVYHGPHGLTRIARRVHERARALANTLSSYGIKIVHEHYFDTLLLEIPANRMQGILARARDGALSFRLVDQTHLGISCDETTTTEDVQKIVDTVIGSGATTGPNASKPAARGVDLRVIPATLQRKSAFLTHEVFNSFHSETEFLRYLKRLESKDLSLGTAMIPLGSCTMKLNATSEMVPVTWPEFGALHPFDTPDQSAGYRALFGELEQALAEITGFSSVSLQPNSGSQGEYAGLLTIRAYHHSRGAPERTICLIPKSAHGTNPASAVMAGFEVVVVECDSQGNVDIQDLSRKAAEYQERLAALMVTYPSTHGVFEEAIAQICEVVHRHGGQVYMDGANLNALVGLCRPADFGADVCHINLHKTFCIPHGGGGPGMGPIGVAKHLAPFLPGHPLVDLEHQHAIGPVSAAPWGSASILTISWMYMAMMGAHALRRATQVAILNANYIAKKLEPHFPTLYRGNNGLVAHECILDLRAVKQSAGIEVDDIAKRLMDYGFHPPTVSWPVPGTLMVEPTESESKAELDRFCDALAAIREEIRKVESGGWSRENNPLKHAPHTTMDMVDEKWDRPYSRELGAFPVPALRAYKFWPTTNRIDASYGDKNLVCTCPPLDAYREPTRS